MEVLFLALLTIFLYLVAYFTYGRWLARRIFGLEEKRICPSRELCDDRDYVPTHPLVVFGHHFTSIAGTGPIVGPAIGVIWGWLPALVWVILGPIFIGAVYDFAALVMSLRNRGKSIGELAGIYLNQRVRLLFMSILVLSLTVVLAVFGLVISAVFRQFPSAIFPCFVQIPIAIVIGLTLHRRSRGILLPSILALVFMYLSIVFSEWGPFHAFNAALASMPLWLWTLILLIYCYLASVLPVWVLLQPRDFINALQLISTLVLLFLGLLVTAIFGGPLIVETSSKYSLEIVAPLLQVHPSGAPPIFPFLFITIACGAVSGFHCLVSSGTSSKQLSSEPHAQFVGYGAMLLEGFLATLVILACIAGLGLGFQLPNGQVLLGSAAWHYQYQSWQNAGSLAATIASFVTGSANFLSSLGIPSSFAIPLMGVFVASFAATTMDTACRLQRYLLEELFSHFCIRGQKGSSSLEKPSASFSPVSSHVCTIVAIFFAALLAAIPAHGQEWSLANAGKGGMLLWPIFGALNQLVAGIAFVIIAFFLRRSNKPIWFLVLPAVFMLVMPTWAILDQLFIGDEASPSWITARNYPLIFIASVSFVLEIWLLVEAVLLWKSLPKSHTKL